MTMQQIHSPKPKVFGEGYGAHLAYNFKLIRLFFKLSLQIFVNAFVPGLYYEQAHWKVIEIYHKMRGLRHGTISDHRCPECGGELLSSEDGHNRRLELKDIEIHCHRIEACDRALEELDMSPEEYQWEMIPEDEKAVIMQRIEDVKNGDVETIDWRDLEEETSDK
jgi:hypothetical protein